MTDFTNEMEDFTRVKLTRVKLTRDNISVLTRDVTNNSYKECLGLWKNARHLAPPTRRTLLTNLMLLWRHSRYLFGNAPGPDPRGPAPSDNHYYCCNSMTWVI